MTDKEKRAKINGDSPAYPLPYESMPKEDQGMTKREVMARDAMRGMLSNPSLMLLESELTECSLDKADALLLALEGDDE